MADSPDDRPPANALPGELVASGEYEDVVELGRGGMGVVYKARNTLLGRVEVLKVMSREVMARAGAADRFRREIQSAARLSHPNVVGAYSARMVGGRLVFSMEYVPGDDFARLVEARGPLPVAHSAYYARQVADGLQHAHEHGMVHRDIKPANLILSRDGKRPVVKILDFGLARLVSDDDDAPRLTAAGRMLGTPAFASPEQALDAQSADIRSDIYSLGCTLYFFLTGRAPFEAGSAVAVLLQHQSATAEYLHTVRPDVPVELAAVVARMMEKHPAKRYPTPAAVAAALAPFGRGLTGPPPAPARMPAPPVARPAAPVKAARPAPPPDALVVQPHPSAWDNLPSLSQSAVATDAVPRRRRQRNRVPLAVGALAVVVVAGVFGMWTTGAFRPAKTGGTVLIDNLPRDAEVEVNGKKVTLSRDGDDWAADLSPGRYRVRVVRGGKELHSETVAIDDAGQRVTVRVPPPAPAPRPPVKDTPPANTGPVFTAADRLRWVHDKGSFTWVGNGDWEEVSPEGVRHKYRETARTPPYVEVQHATINCRVRFYSGRCDIAYGGADEFRTLHSGGWVAAPPGTQPPGPVPPVTPVPATPPSAPPPAPKGPSPTPGPTPSPPQPVNYSSGNWRIMNNELIGVRDPTKIEMPSIRFGSPDWSDVTFEFEAKAIGGKPDFWAESRVNHELIKSNTALNTSDVKAFFAADGASLVSWRNNTSIGSIARAWKDKLRPSPDQGGRVVPENQWFSVSLTTAGQKADLKIDNRPWVSLTFTRPETWSGNVGLVVKSGTTAFRNIRVKSPTGAVLWNRLPDVP